MINIFKKSFVNKTLSHILILLISSFISYLALSSSSNKNSNLTEASLIAHAPCNILNYAGDLYALMDKFRKRSVLISHEANVLCTDYSLFKFNFIFKTIHTDYVKKELKNDILFNLDNHEAIKLEIKEKITSNESLIKNLEKGYDIFKLEGLDYTKVDRSMATQDINIKVFLRIVDDINKLEFENRHLKRLLKFNGAKYDLNLRQINKRENFSYFNNSFIIIFFLTILIYFILYLFITMLPKFNSDLK